MDHSFSGWKMKTCDLTRVWSEEFKVHSYEMGPSGFASPQTKCQFLKEAANNHAEKLGYSFEELDRLEQMWVLSQMSLRMARYPRGRETVQIETWPVSKQSNIRGYRDFTLLNSTGEILGRASTMWLLLKQDNRKPLKLPEELLDLCSLGHSYDFLNPPKDSNFEDSPETVQEFVIRASDIDWNMHVNNVCYLEWSLEAIPAIFRLKNKLTELDMSFLGEGKYGSSVLAECFKPAEQYHLYLHRIKDKSSGKILAQLRTRWEPKQVQQD